MRAGRLASTVACSLPLLCRIDARRPASWIALATGGVAAAGGSGPVAHAMACACGGLAAVAAVGDPVRVDGSPDLTAACTVARVAWPLAGVALGWWAAALGGHAAAWSAIAAGLGVVFVAAVRLIASSAAAAWWSAWRPGDSPPALATERDGVHAAFGHHVVDRLAMAATLAAMVVWYFLVPAAAAWYAVLVGGLFVLLTVPSATSGPTVADEGARSLLVRTMPEPCGLPGTLPRSLRMIVVSASLLAWPALVAAVLRSELALVPTGPAGSLALLAALAAITAGGAWIAHARGVGGDTARALVLAGVAALILGAGRLLS